MSNSKILPFDCNVVYSLDCRVSCRLGIIQVSSNGQAWLATHLDVLMSNNLDINFGSGIYVAQMNYYDDILDTREIDLWSSEPDKIIDIIKMCIRDRSWTFSIVMRCWTLSNSVSCSALSLGESSMARTVTALTFVCQEYRSLKLRNAAAAISEGSCVLSGSLH